MSRITDKIREIEDYLERLTEIIPKEVEEYKKDHKTKAACERYFEKIVEAVIDLSFLIVKEKSLKIPEDSEGVFDVLKEENIISEKLAEKLKDAKGMRNIISHQYGKVDDEIVFESITGQLERDVIEFLGCVEDGES